MLGHKNKYHAMTISSLIMNWSIARINNYEDITMVEANTASRSLNRFTLCIIVSGSHIVHRLSPAALLDWRRAN